MGGIEEKEFKATNRLFYSNFYVSFSSSNTLRVSCQISLWSDAVPNFGGFVYFYERRKSYLKMSKRASHKSKKKITTHIFFILYVCTNPNRVKKVDFGRCLFMAYSIGCFSISNCIGACWRFASKIFIVHILWALDILFSINKIKFVEDDYNLCVLYGLNGLICVISEKFALKTLQIKFNVL